MNNTPSIKSGKLKGIPTKYKGVQYRSRLEAKWAVMFDMLGWVYQYEPFDLPGWIPDFVLLGKKRTTLVEVKPYSTLEQFKSSGTIAKNLEAMKGSAYEDCELLLLGSSVIQLDYWEYRREDKGMHAVIGWLGEWGAFDNAILVHDNIYDFFHELGSWVGRMGCSTDGKYLWEETVLVEDFRHLWNKAGNVVQWKAPKGTN